MRRPVRIVLWILGAFSAALVLAAVALPFLIDAERLRPQAEAMLTERLGRKVGFGRLELSLWRGVALRTDRFRIGEPLQGDPRGAPILEAGPTAIRIAVLPLLRKSVDARSIRIASARITKDGQAVISDMDIASSLRVTPDGTIDAAGRVRGILDASPGRLPFRAEFATRIAGGALELHALDATLGTLALRAKGRVEGIGTATPEAAFDLSSPMLGGATLHGLALRDVTAAARYEDGVLGLRDLRFALYGGAGKGSVTVRPLESGIPFSVEQSVEGVALGELVGALAPAQKGTIEGTAALAVRLAGRGGEPSVLPSVSGSGVLSVRDGSIKSVGMIEQVTKLLEAAGAAGMARRETPFESLTAHFTVQRGVASTRDLAFRSADLDFDGAGTVGLGGALKLDVLAAFSKAASGGLVAKTPALSVRVGDDGRLTVPLQIRGTVQEPRVQLDMGKVLNEGVSKKLKKEGTKRLLDKILGR